MAALSAVALCVVCIGWPSVPAVVAQWQPIIAQASKRFGVPQSWIERVMAVESGGRSIKDGRPIRSPAGAIGLMQLMPATYAEMQRRYGLGREPADSEDNILAGTAYLRVLYQAYGYPYLFAAYQAGPGRFDDFLLRYRPLPAVTIGYLNRPLPEGFHDERLLGASQYPVRQVVQNPSSGLFFAVGEATNTRSGDTSLLVPLSARAP